MAEQTWHIKRPDSVDIFCGLTMSEAGTCAIPYLAIPTADEHLCTECLSRWEQETPLAEKRELWMLTGYFEERKAGGREIFTLWIPEDDVLLGVFVSINAALEFLASEYADADLGELRPDEYELLGEKSKRRRWWISGSTSDQTFEWLIHPEPLRGKASVPEGEYRIGFREDRRLGGHVTISVFVGRKVGSRGRAGTIVLRGEEWEEMRGRIERREQLLADFIGVLGKAQEEKRGGHLIEAPDA